MTIRPALIAAILGAAVSLPAFATEDEIVSDRARIMGDYLAGSYARYLNDPRAQSRFFDDAYALSPTDNRLGRLALYSSLFAGDEALTKKTAERIYRQDKTESMARAVLSVEAFSRGRAARVRKYASEPTADLTMGMAMRLVLGWSMVDEGRYQSARDLFSDMGDPTYFQVLGQLQIAKLEARRGNVEAATEAFDRVEKSGLGIFDYDLARVRFEATNGQKDAAIERLEGLIANNPAADLGPAGAYLDRLQDRKRLPRLSVRAEAARALTDPSFAFFVRNNSVDGAETFLRFARWVDPDFDRAAIWLGSLLEETHPVMDDMTRAEIFELYQSIGSKSPYYVNARMAEANQYFDLEQDETALEILAELAEDHPSYFTREALGRARFFREKWDEALPFYTDLVESLSEKELAANPEPLRLRGIIYERLDRWSEAEADFQRVLEYEPDDADTLNYLGYTWVDRGENLEEAFELIERAVELEPDSGAILDSLGWAHYKLGRYEEAKKYLEMAVVLTPYSATIIDHLGDAYWQIGRKRDATYQWARALEFDATEEEAAAINAKLAAGANAVPAS